MKQVDPKIYAAAFALRLGCDINVGPKTEVMAERSLVEIFRACRKKQGLDHNLRRAGMAVAGSDSEVVRAEFSYGGLVGGTAFTDALGKVVTTAFNEAKPTWRRWANPAEVDRLTGEFTSTYPVASPPEVLPGREISPAGGNIKTTSLSLQKNARILQVSFEAVMNDDVQLIQRLVREEVAATVRQEDDKVYVCLTTVTGFFVTANGNRLTGSALTGDNLATAMKTVRTMAKKGVKYRLEPKVLLVPAALEHTARTILHLIDEPLEVVAESRLDEDSTTSWYLVGDKTQIDSIVLQYLKGFSVPEVIRRPGTLDFDGVQYRIKHVCGAAAPCPQGIVKSEA